MVNVNLLPVTSRRRVAAPDAQKWMLASGAALLLALGAVVVAEAIHASKVSQFNAAIDEQQGIIDANRPKYEQYQALLKERSDLEKVTNVAKELRDKKRYWSNDLAAFTAQIPSGNRLSLQSIAVSSTPNEIDAIRTSGEHKDTEVRRNIELQAAARTQQDIIDFMGTFENNPNFGVALNSIEREEADNPASLYNFAAEVAVMDRPEEESLGATTAASVQADGAATTETDDTTDGTDTTGGSQ